MTHFILRPATAITNPMALFNFSSINASLNIISLLYFIIVSIFRNMIPKDQIISWYVYAGIFFVMLSFLLDGDNIPGRPSAGGVANRDQTPFTEILSESDIILV